MELLPPAYTVRADASATRPLADEGPRTGRGRLRPVIAALSGYPGLSWIRRRARCLLRASTEGDVVSQARFQKQQREKARRERAAAKWAKRVERMNPDAPPPAVPVREQADVLAELATLHARFDAGAMSFEDFEVTKQQVTDQLDIR